VCLISAPQGIERMRGAHPDVPIWTAAMVSVDAAVNGVCAESACSSEQHAYPNLARTMVWSPRGTVARHSPSSGCAASCGERFRAGVWDVPT
jgi:hypothetical protein